MHQLNRIILDNHVHFPMWIHLSNVTAIASIVLIDVQLLSRIIACKRSYPQRAMLLLFLLSVLAGEDMTDDSELIVTQ